MKYAKLIDGFPAYAPNPIKHDGLWYGNPPGSVYEAEGYKPVVYTDHGMAPSGYAWREAWTEEEGNIQQSWVLEQIPITEDEALTSYSNKLSGAQDETLQDAAETLIKKVKGDN